METTLNPAATLPREVDDAGKSGVTWSAVFAGAAAAAALSYILVILGFGLGLSSVSPWSGSGASATAIGLATIAWLTFTQIAASGMGGYLAGRLRVKWTNVHTDEVYFRDTAHGFLSWCVASLVVVTFLASSLGGIVGAGASATGSALGGVAAAAAPAVAKGAEKANDESGYFVDMLLRRDPATATTESGDAQMTAEAGRILARSVASGSIAPEDKHYLAQLIAKHSNLSEADAEQRIDATMASMKSTADAAIAKAKSAADQARKAAAALALWTFISLLCGAFFASWAATFGGRRRDRFVRAS